jgi:hypothetical protein
MEKFWEYCQSKYKDELGFKFSLANLFSLLLFMTAAFMQTSTPADNLYGGLTQLKVKSLIDMTDGVIPSLTMMQLFWSIAFVIGIVWISRNFSEGMFYLFSLKSDFQQTIIDMSCIYAEQKKNPTAMHELGVSAKTELEKKQKQANRSRAFTEIFLSVCCITILLFPLTATNICVSVGAFAIYGALTWKSFYFFVAEILPYHVAVRYSRNELTMFLESYKITQVKE